LTFRGQRSRSNVHHAGNLLPVPDPFYVLKFAFVAEL